MKQLLLILVVIVLNSCCCGHSKEDFRFADFYNQLLMPYVEGDTVYFVCQTGDMDTIVISKVETLQKCGCIATTSSKQVSVAIKHLPYNNWISDDEMSAGSLANKPDQNLVVVKKHLSDGTSMHVRIHYRDMVGNLLDTYKVNHDNRLNKLGITSYWIIDNEIARQGRYDDDSAIMTKIFWTDKFGLTGYEYRNGLVYEIMK